MGTEWDAVVVGSGPNGLTGAAVLAEAGWRVCVFEAADAAGGGLRTEALTLPGFRHDVCSTVHPLAVASPALLSLGLEREGLAFAHGPVPLAHPLDGRPAALLHRDLAATVSDLDRDGGSGGTAWRRLFGPLVRAADEVTAGILSPFDVPPAHPVALARFGVRGVWPAAALARAVLRDERGQALFGGLAAHSMLDLRHPITAGYGLMLGVLAHHHGWPVAVGGSQAIADALVARLRALGGEVVTGHRIEALAELPLARATLLDVTPRQLLAMAGEELPARYAARLRRFRYGSGAFKVDWALDGPVPWTDPAVADAPTVHLGGTIDQIVAAEREVARGSHPDKPFVLFVQASVADPTRAPGDGQTAWAYCHVPAGSTVDMTGAIEAQVERFAPGFRDRVLARHVMPPAALEAHNANYIGGAVGGGTADLRQFLARPSLPPNPWETPLPGVYLCSASTPPGAGVHGMGGWHAAHLALRRR